MRTSFLKKLQSIQADIPSMSAFVVPSSFDPADETMLAFPLPLSWRWGSCERFLRERSARVVMTRLPLFWQLEPLLHDACATLNLPMFLGNPHNIPVDAAAVAAIHIDTVVTSADDVAAFVTHLSSRAIPLPENWLVVFKPEQSWDKPALLQERDLCVQHEVHLFPGVVMLEQCQLPDAKATLRFHVGENIHMETRGQVSFVTIDKELPFPVTDLELPFTLRTDGGCACGRETVRKAP